MTARAANLVLDDPSIIGKYRVLLKLGEGGMASVYLAVAHGLSGFSKLLVLKVLKPSLAEEPELVRMFLNEARLAARLNHPNVVQTYEVGEQDGRHMIVMEYLEGQPLNLIRRAARKEGIPYNLHVTIIAEALSGLHYAHELKDLDGSPLGLVHRDVSAGNLFVTYQGQCKLLDFGIAKAANRQGETRSDILKGTVRYMAPEALLGEPLDRRADVYSAGVLLWEAAAGRRAWDGMSDVQIIQRVVNGDLPPVREMNPEAPEVLADICHKALARSREDRFGTALELREALEDFLGSHGVSARALAKRMDKWFQQPREEREALVRRRLHELSSGTDQGVLAADTGATSSFSLSRQSQSQLQVAAQHRKWQTLLLLVAVLAVAGGFWLFRSGSKSSSDSAAAEELRGEQRASAAGVQTVADRSAEDAARRDHADGGRPATSAQAERIQVYIRANPPDAQLFWGDQPLSSNPADLRLPKDGSKVTVYAKAPGYVDRKVEVELARDLDIVLSLSPVPRRRSTTRRTQTRDQGQTGKDETSSQQQDRRTRKLDTENPWAQ